MLRQERRRPVDWRLYATHVRRAQKRVPRHEHPLLVTVVASLVFAVAGLQLLSLVGIGLGTGLNTLGRSIVQTLPQAKESELVLGETPVSVTAAPILDPLPEFTKTSALTFGGKVPAFAVAPGRVIALSLNGEALSSYALAADGRFGPATITLPDGSSTITARLMDGTVEIASTSATTVVDRTPPPLQITRPKTGDTVDGPDVVIEGKTEAGIDLIVNDRAVRPLPDGTFTERIAAVPAGPLAITVVARDKAGNETKTALAITVKATTQTTFGTALAITLDRAKVKPGETVVARVIAVENGRPRADLAVTLQVGVITIGTYRTDAAGVANIGFAAPNHEVDDVAVVILGGGASARATLTVSTK